MLDSIDLSRGFILYQEFVSKPNVKHPQWIFLFLRSDLSS